MVVFVVKSVAEFGGSALVQFVGLRALTDLRNEVYAKIIRQPIGFFQHQPTGRVMSAVINDVERARPALSEYLADVFRQTFLFIAFVAVLLSSDWRMALCSAVFFPLTSVPAGNWCRSSR